MKHRRETMYEVPGWKKELEKRLKDYRRQREVAKKRETLETKRKQASTNEKCA